MLGGTASASPLGYLQSTNNRGMTVYNTAQALSYAYEVCEPLNYTTGDVVASQVFRTTRWADVPSMYCANVIVISAVEQLCPWHDHRGEVTATAWFRPSSSSRTQAHVR